jgi:hypothetical protein
MTRAEWKKLSVEAMTSIQEDPPVLRSCWNCNESHEYLKRSAFVFNCLECGDVFYKGHNLSVLLQQFEDVAEGWVITRKGKR